MISITDLWISVIELWILYTFVFLHDDIIKWKYFSRYWPFVRGIHRSPVNSPHKGQWRGALMFSLICVEINGWLNNCEAGDLIRHQAHYEVTVMYSRPTLSAFGCLNGPGPVSQGFSVTCGSNVTNIAFCYNSFSDHQITTNLVHVVVLCTKHCSDRLIRIWMRAKRKDQRI